MGLGESLVSCPHGRDCGACAWLDVPYAAQLEDKRALLAERLRRYARLARVEVLPALPSPRTSGYRNRAKMAVREGRPLRMGYFRTGSRDLVDAPRCQVLEPALRETLDALRPVLARSGLRALRFVDLRSGSDSHRQHLTLVLGTTTMPRLPVDDVASACPHVRGISVNFNPGAGPQVLKGPVKHVWGEDGLTMHVGSVSLRVSPSAFFQVNLHVLPAIHERLRAHLGRGRALVDLYAGVGTHGIGLHDAFHRVLCIEGHVAAIRDARQSVAALSLANLTLVGSPVEKCLPRIATARAEALVLNPSRQGARPEVLQAVAASEARRVAYLSCEPETLARDLDQLVSSGFRVTSVEPVDMMPQTRQVEALALLHRDAGVRAPSVGGRGGLPRRGRGAAGVAAPSALPSPGASSGAPARSAPGRAGSARAAAG